MIEARLLITSSDTFFSSRLVSCNESYKYMYEKPRYVLTRLAFYNLVVF